MSQRLTDNYTPLNEGRAKKEATTSKFPNRDTITGTRKVQVNKNTWVYTKQNIPDEEIIEKFNQKFGI